MKLNALLPVEPPLTNEGVSFSDLFHAEQTLVNWHFRNLMNMWNVSLTRQGTAPTKMNYIFVALHYMYNCQQEFEPQEVMLFSVMVGIAASQLDKDVEQQEEAIKRDKQIPKNKVYSQDISDLLLPLAQEMLDCGVGYQDLINRLYNRVKREFDFRNAHGMPNIDDVFVSIMQKELDEILRGRLISTSDSLRIAYAMGLINSDLGGRPILNLNNILAFNN